MSYMRRAAAGMFVGLLLLGLGAPAQASAALKFEDPAGDQLDARGSMDIVSVSLEIKPMAPRNTISMVTTIELAAAPEAALVSYDLNATVPGCGYFTASYRPGTLGAELLGSQVNQYFMECGSPEGTGTGTSTAVDALAEVDGNKVIIWSALAAFPEEVRETGELTEISAQTQVAEPVFGILGNGIFVPTDEAATEDSWSFA